MNVPLEQSTLGGADVGDAPALEVVDVGKARLCRRPIQLPKLGEVLVQVDYSGVSIGTEIWAATDRLPPGLRHWGAMPFVPGYQAVGRVAALGKEVSMSVGDMVAVSGVHSHQRYVVANTDNSFRIRSNDRNSAAAFFVAASASAHFLNRAGVQCGDSVIVVGQGFVGQVTAQLARLRGAYVIGTEISPARIGISSKYCVDRLIDGTSDVAWTQIGDELPDGADVVIHTADISINDSLKCVRPGGTFLWVGSNPSGGLQFDIEEPHTKQLNWAFAHGPGSRANRERIVDMLSAGMLDLGPLITHTVKWQEAADVYNRLFTPERDSFGAIAIDWRDAR